MPTERKKGDIVEIIRADIAVRRPYAQFFDWSNKTIKELGVAQSWQWAVTRMNSPLLLSDIQPRARSEDPPDVEGLDDKGRRTAIEITELVSESAVRANLRAKAQGRSGAFAVWTREEVIAALTDRLSTKAKRRSDLKGGPYPGGYVVVVHTDEPWLRAENIFDDFLRNHVFGPFPEIDRAFLLISYEPRIAGYPCFELRLQPNT